VRPPAFAARGLSHAENPRWAANSTRARLLAGNVKDLINAPITYFDGRNDNYESPPRETRHLRTIAIGQPARPRSLQESRSLRRGKKCPDEDSSFVEEVNRNKHMELKTSPGGASTANPAPEGMHAVTPHLVCAGAAQAICVIWGGLCCVSHDCARLFFCKAKKTPTAGTA
jgi:hypothetical protein